MKLFFQGVIIEILVLVLWSSGEDVTLSGSHEFDPRQDYQATEIPVAFFVAKRSEIVDLQVLGYYGGTYLSDGACSGYLVSWDQNQILLDMGSGVLGQLQKVMDPNQLDAVYISHFHYDHYSDLGVFIHHRKIERALGKTDRDLHIFAPYHNYYFEKFGKEDFITLHRLEPGIELHDGEAKIQCLRTAHPLECYACKIIVSGKTLVYTADSGYTDTLVDFAKDADLLIAECSLPMSQDYQEGHMRVDEVKRLAKESQVKKLLVSHLPVYETISKEEFDDLDMPVIFPKPGRRIQI